MMGGEGGGIKVVVPTAFRMLNSPWVKHRW
jgi:hypothetical protein